MGIAGFGWGAASDRIGTRPVVLSGAVLLGLGLCLASRSTSLIEFQLTYGILVGLAAGRILRADDRGSDNGGSTITAVWRFAGVRGHGYRSHDDLADGHAG